MRVKLSKHLAGPGRSELSTLFRRSTHAFLTLRQHYHPHYLIERLLALIDDPDAQYDPYGELRTLQYWAAVNRCDRRAINRQLRQPHASTYRSEAR
jgi:hypothetical protein